MDPRGYISHETIHATEVGPLGHPSENISGIRSVRNIVLKLEQQYYNIHVIHVTVIHVLHCFSKNFAGLFG